MMKKKGKDPVLELKRSLPDWEFTDKMDSKKEVNKKEFDKIYEKLRKTSVYVTS